MKFSIRTLLILTAFVASVFGTILFYNDYKTVTSRLEQSLAFAIESTPNDESELAMLGKTSYWTLSKPRIYNAWINSRTNNLFVEFISRSPLEAEIRLEFAGGDRDTIKPVADCYRWNSGDADISVTFF